jgi:hypothetical protein
MFGNVKSKMHGYPLAASFSKHKPQLPILVVFSKIGVRRIDRIDSHVIGLGDGIFYGVLKLGCLGSFGF